MNRPVGRVRIMSQHLHNVDLTTFRPLPIIPSSAGIIQNAEENLFLPELYARFKYTICKIMLILCIHSSGSVGNSAIRIFYFDCFQYQMSILNKNIFVFIYIFL